ncbi:MAG: molybdopterin-dependent oxidoreductase [Acidobacteria bacterium]|nr:molybdopterin-dependent oxidoreductase [Acidobacteriota bacterium]
MIRRTQGSEAQLTTRRDFVRAGGALFVSLAAPLGEAAQIVATATTPDPTLLASWLEIRHDNTILLRTGRTETGTGMSAFYAQTLAEELRVRPEVITLIMGDTDRTPDGGYSAGFLIGAANVRKVGAYTYQALLSLAAEQLQVPASSITITAGVAAGGGKSLSYGQLLEGRHLDLKIPVTGKPTGMDASFGWGVGGLMGYSVTGNPPVKPVSEYTVVGTSFPMPGIPDKVTGRTAWSCDVPVPGLEGNLLHARMIRPPTVGSTLITAGTVDKKRFPTARVIAKGNLVAVVSPDEWEAVTAARAFASSTKWTAWSGLPGSEQLTTTLRARDWGTPSTRGDATAVIAALAQAERTVSASFEQPYVRHAPIGPYVAVADVRRDGTVTVWTHSSQSQGLRAQIANTLSVPREKVVIRWLDHAGQYGRTTHSGDGAEGDAVILSQLTGQPVRVQWMLPEDMAWSTASPGWIADIKGGLDAQGRITAVESAFRSPHMMDARLLGAILGRMPTTTTKSGNWNAIEWPYDRIKTRFEAAYGMPNLAGEAAHGGLRGNIMRTPGHRQQNFVLESMINEAAALAGADPIQFRREHTTEPRLLELLDATAQAAGWEARPSPRPGAGKTGNAPLIGRGAGIIFRDNAYWVGIAEVEVTPATGVVRATRFTIGADVGKVINPRHLDRCMKSGAVMGLSEALKEEVTFDRERVTSTDWNRYKILTMQEMPELRVVQISRDDKGFGTGGEASNAVAPSAVVAAFFDATGIFPRRIPLTPNYVKALLNG